MNQRKKAFTLIELLVVISIIALLLSILMPGLTRAKYLAKRLVCSSNIRSQSQILFIYATSTNGKFPIHGAQDPMCVRSNANPPDEQFERVWEVLQGDYVADGSIFKCPVNARFGGPAADSEWRSPLNSDEGGWDAVDSVNGNIPLPYLLIAYGWFANYNVVWGGNPVPITMEPGEEPWPDKMEDCKSANVIIAHLALGYAGNLQPEDWWNMTHGGSPMVGIDVKPVKFSDNPIGHGDGSVKVYQKTEMAARGGPGGFRYWY